MAVLGGPQVRFTIGAGDKQALHPPLNNMIPITRRTVAVLFQELGKLYNLSTFQMSSLVLGTTLILGTVMEGA